MKTCWRCGLRSSYLTWGTHFCCPERGEALVVVDGYYDGARPLSELEEVLKEGRQPAKPDRSGPAYQPSKEVGF